MPVGFNHHASPVNPLHDGLRGVGLVNVSKKLSARYDTLSIMEEIGKYDHKRVFNQLGTLGGGNHFIELCLDESNAVWVMLHSGSPNIGKTIGETVIHMARQIAEREERGLRDKDLAWLDEGTAEFDMYVEGLRWAQDYAPHNRALMMHAVLLALREVRAPDRNVRQRRAVSPQLYVGRRTLRPAGLGNAQGCSVGAQR